MVWLRVAPSGDQLPVRLPGAEALDGKGVALAGQNWRSPLGRAAA